MAERTFHSELIDLPSKGWYYDPKSPLASGKVDLRYLTAREEDILTSTNLIQKGVVLEKLMDALIVNKAIKQDDLLICDWDGLMVASRIMGYGKEYTVTVLCPVCGVKQEQAVDLTTLKDKEVSEPANKGKNEFTFTLPNSKVVLTYQLMTHGLGNAVSTEIAALRKASTSDIDVTPSTRLKYIITAVSGNKDTQTIRNFVDNEFLARDSRAFRDQYAKVTPGIDLRFTFHCQKCGEERRMALPLGLDFFWPQSGV